jgi:hypothetical protein
LKIIENNTFFGDSYFRDLEYSVPFNLNYTIVVNDKKYETEAVSDTSRILIKDGIDKSYDKCLSRFLASGYRNDNLEIRSKGEENSFIGEFFHTIKNLQLKS